MINAQRQEHIRTVTFAGKWPTTHCLCAFMYAEGVCGDGRFVTAAIWCTGIEAHDDNNMTLTT